ncbi:MAG: hypothetical protein MHPSP_001963, partial [Paramarteilia canceri]
NQNFDGFSDDEERDLFYEEIINPDVYFILTLIEKNSVFTLQTVADIIIYLYFNRSNFQKQYENIIENDQKEFEIDKFHEMGSSSSSGYSKSSNINIGEYFRVKNNL